MSAVASVVGSVWTYIFFNVSGIVCGLDFVSIVVYLGWTGVFV